MGVASDIQASNLGGEYAFIRRVLGLKQSDFAKLIGVSTQTINSIEKGGTISRETVLKTYAELSGVIRMKNEIPLRDEEIFAIDRFIEKIVLYIDEISKDVRLKIRRS